MWFGELMVHRFKFIGITVLSILILTIVGAVSLSPAYAATMTLNISPNPALPNQPVTFSGQVSPPNGASDSVAVAFYTGAGCVNGNSFNFVPGHADSGGSYSLTWTGGFSSGSYSAQAQDENYAPIVLSPCMAFTVSTAIPEYPFGLAVLAIFMIIAYGVIRRKTITKQK